jgi:protein-S-isoprenylcysteine O-methyltransferase Ste14
MFERPFFKAIYRWRVRAGSLAFLICIVLAKPIWKSVAIGAGISLAGLLMRAWAAGHLKKEKELAVSGPYRFSRNPLYLGNLILGLSLAIGSNSAIVAIIFVAYFLIFYPVIILTERERMKRLFPDKYKEYIKHVPLLFPWRKPMVCREKVGFDWRLYRSNKEYRALFGSLIYWLILSARILLKF